MQISFHFEGANYFPFEGAKFFPFLKVQNSFNSTWSFTYEFYCRNEGANFFPFWRCKNFPFLKVQNSFHLHSIWSYELKLLTNVNVQKSVLFLKVKVKMQISFHLQGCLFCLFYFVYEDEDEGEDAKNYTKANECMNNLSLCHYFYSKILMSHMSQCQIRILTQPSHKCE